MESFWPRSTKYQHRGDSVVKSGCAGSWTFALSCTSSFHDLDLFSGQKLLTSQMLRVNRNVYKVGAHILSFVRGTLTTMIWHSKSIACIYRTKYFYKTFCFNMIVFLCAKPGPHIHAFFLTVGQYQFPTSVSNFTDASVKISENKSKVPKSYGNPDNRRKMKWKIMSGYNAQAA